MSLHETAAGFEWLYSVLSADSTLAAKAPGGVWRALAPPTTVTPFVIMSFQAGTDVTTMNGFRQFVEGLYQVKAVGPAADVADVVSAAEQIDLLLGGPPGIPAAGTTADNLAVVLACYRQSPLEIDEIINGELWTNLGGLYRLQIEQKN